MTTPNRDGFVGLGGRNVPPAAADFIAQKPGDESDRFTAHFRQVGVRHADILTRDFLALWVQSAVQPPSIAAAGIGDFTADTPAKREYTAGLCAQLAYNADAMRGIVALRQLQLPPDYRNATFPAADLPSQECLAAASALAGLSGNLATALGIDPPPRLQARHWQPNTAQQHARPASGSSVVDQRAQPAGTALQPPPGTAAARHGGTASQASPLGPRNG